MEMMKAVRDVETATEVKPRRIPSPKIPKMKKVENFSNLQISSKPKLKTPKVKSAKSKAKSEVDIFQVIGNPLKMSDEPISEDGSVKKNKKKKKKGKKNKTKGKKTNYTSSDGSFSVSSYDGESYMGSLGSIGSFESNEDSLDSERSFGSGSSFEGRQNYTRKKRKEEIMQEKIEMLTRISNMSRMGFTATRKWSMKDDIDEIRFECYRMTRENNSRKSVKNMQHMLITAATIVEFANSIVNPFNLKLEGFSKNLMLTVSDYDDSLEELHHKWSGRTSVGPEMTVLFTFVTSAIFHHAGNVMSSSHNEQPASRSAQPPKTKGPDMSSVFGLFSNMMPKSSTRNAPNTPNTPNTQDSGTENSTQTKTKTRRPMKGPGGAGGIPFANLIPSMHVP